MTGFDAWRSLQRVLIIRIHLQGLDIHVTRIIQLYVHSPYHGLFKGASPPPMHIFQVVARDYILETTVAISM